MKLLISKQILPVSSLGNAQRTVWRICILMLEFKGLIALPDALVKASFLKIPQVETRSW